MMPKKQTRTKRRGEEKSFFSRTRKEGQFAVKWQQNDRRERKKNRQWGYQIPSRVQESAGKDVKGWPEYATTSGTTYNKFDVCIIITEIGEKARLFAKLQPAEPGRELTQPRTHL